MREAGGDGQYQANETTIVGLGTSVLFGGEIVGMVNPIRVQMEAVEPGRGGVIIEGKT